MGSDVIAVMTAGSAVTGVVGSVVAVPGSDVAVDVAGIVDATARRLGARRRSLRRGGAR